MVQSLRWTSRHGKEEKRNLVIDAAGGVRVLLFKKELKSLGHVLNRKGRMQQSLEEMMQKANRAGWADAKIFNSKHDVETSMHQCSGSCSCVQLNSVAAVETATLSRKLDAGKRR